MKKYIVLSVLTLLCLFTSDSFSQDKGFGVGIILGEPSGISAKYWLNTTNAFAYGLGTSFTSNGKLQFHVDYLWHAYNLVTVSNEKIVLYYGPGVRINTRKNGESQLGIRGVFGADWFIQKYPMDVFLEIVPVLNLTPDVDFSFNSGIGVRYFFN